MTLTAAVQCRGSESKTGHKGRVIILSRASQSISFFGLQIVLIQNSPGPEQVPKTIQTPLDHSPVQTRRRLPIGTLELLG